MPTVSYTFSTGQQIVAAQVNANFDDLEAALSNLDTNNLADDAGIRATQIADRFAIFEVNITLVPFVSAGVSANAIVPVTTAGTLYQLDSSMNSGSYQTILRRHCVFDSGQEAYLCEIELYLAQQDDTPQFRLLRNGTVIGAAGISLDTDNAFYRARNANPVDSPLAAFVDGDELTYQLASSTATQADIRGLHIRETWKARMVN